MILAGQRRGRADVVESRIERRGEKIGQARGEWGFTVRTPAREGGDAAGKRHQRTTERRPSRRGSI